MKTMLLAKLIAASGILGPSGRVAGVRIKGVTSDSRQVVRGSLFVAVKGVEGDGHRYCRQALRAGAAALVVEERPLSLPSSAVTICVVDSRRALERLVAVFHDDPQKRIACCGVTGTNGKTTTAFLIQNILAAADRRCGLLGTIGYDVGSGLIPMKNTTPGLTELYDVLARMVRARCTYAAMEVSSHALDQGRVAGVIFRTAVFTNLTQDHLDYHKTRARYFAAKKRLFTDHLTDSSTRIINADDPFGMRLRKGVPGRLLTYGLGGRADVRAVILKEGWAGSRLKVTTPRGRLEITTPLVGRYNVYNVLAAAAVGVAEGVPAGALRRGIRGCGSIPGRLERVKNNRGIHLFVDYAHTDDALKNVLESLRRIPHNGNIITVFGCGGDRDSGKRPKMGRVASRLSDHVIVTSDNPRSEDPGAIIRAILKGVKGRRWEVDPDRRQAIGKALDRARRGDVVLIAGKGHEVCQISRGAALPFDDRLVARAFLA